MEKDLREKLYNWAEEYNDPQYFKEDPLIFPTEFAKKLQLNQASLKDVEIAAVFSSHLAWGRRSMIVRDCERLFDHMQWKPWAYIQAGDYRDDDKSIHRTIKWKDIAKICRNLKDFYQQTDSLEVLNNDQIRTLIYSQKSDPKAANKKINMFKRWLVRNDGKVDLGLWHNTKAENLIIPLDVHVYNMANELGMCKRKSRDLFTAMEITEHFKEIFPEDPCKGDFALFGYGVIHSKK